MIRRLTRRRNEDGAALILALAFLTLFSVLIVSLLSQGFTSARNTGITRERADGLATVDAALQVALHRARDAQPVAGIQDTFCPTPVISSSGSVFPGVAMNGMQATAICQNVEGVAATYGYNNVAGVIPPAAQRWSVITRSTANGSLTTTGSGGGKTVTGGDVYIGGSPTLNRPLIVDQGDVEQGAASCPVARPPISQLAGVDPPDTWSCVPNAAADIPDVAHNVGPRYSTKALALGSFPCPNGQSWTIHRPGTFRPGDTFDMGARVYLESGIYYFEDYHLNVPAGVITVLGGLPPTGETSGLGLGSPCGAIPFPVSARGTSNRGVTIVLGGKSSITVAGSTQFELYSGVLNRSSYPSSLPADVNGPDFNAAFAQATPGISIITANSDMSTGVCPRVPEPSISTCYKTWEPDPAASITSPVNVAGSSVQVDIHGLVYAPTAPLTFFARNPAPLQGGVVANRLTLDGGAGNLPAVVARGRRTLLLLSNISSGGNATTVRAVVKVANDPARTATVRSWRVQ